MSKPLTDLLSGVVKQYGLESALLREQLPRIWAQVVGKRVATISTVRSFDGGVLRIHISEPTWRMELTLRKEELRLQMNERIGNDAIKELRLM
ncbi:MAG: DUF721 domain-containing protein [Bradyrhizobiaceae bacterium]|nr:DUF721 domain-containing protein [Bradyrhizobiaceae bacterium]